MLRKLTALGEEGAFSPEDVRVLVAAFDAAWASLKASGAPVADPLYQETAREVIAKFIIQAVKNGERKERVLIEGALLQLANLRRNGVENPPVSSPSCSARSTASVKGP